MAAKRKSKKKKATKSTAKKASGRTASPKYPRHSLLKALRVPEAILEQNAGKACADNEAAKFVGVGFGGPFKVELSSGIKYGLLDRPETGQVGVTDLAKRIIRPQSPQDKTSGLQEAVLNAPDFSTVYRHYRGENLPDRQFFENALVDTFGIPQEKVAEFVQLFSSVLEEAGLIEEHAGGKRRILDVSVAGETGSGDAAIRKLGKEAKVEAGDTCFVVMPFGDPIGKYYESIYDPAIRKAGLTPVRADADIFATGKIMDQVWRGIRAAKVLVAELTTRNPNVYYELGLAHALEKPVVLVSSNEEDVPFDLQHIRVIYYDVTDPFWGDKLISKVAENILSAIRNPEEAVFALAAD